MSCPCWVSWIVCLRLVVIWFRSWVLVGVWVWFIVWVSCCWSWVGVRVGLVGVCVCGLVVIWIVVWVWVICGGWFGVVWVAVVRIIIIWVSGCLFGLLVLSMRVPSGVVWDWVSGMVSHLWVVVWLAGVVGFSCMRSPGV